MTRLVALGAAGVVALGVLAAGLVLALGGGGPQASAPSAAGTAPGGYRGGGVPSGLRLPAFALHDLDDRPISAGQLRGRVVLLTFFDSRCREACPLIAAKLAVALARLSPAERGELVALALSMNPRDDTPASARRFMREHRLLGRMRYLVGSIAQLRPVWKRFHVLSSLDSGDADIHSAAVRIYDRAGRWVASFNEGVDLTPQNVTHDVRLALHQA